MNLILTGTGTSQGAPVLTCSCEVCLSTDPRDSRLRTSALLQAGKKNIVIDAGPDLRQQMLKHKVKHVDAVLLTHQHHDHVGGMDDLRPYIFRKKKPMDVYAGHETIAAIQKMYYYAFEIDLYPGAPTFNMIPVEGSPFFINDTEVQPVAGMHGKMPVWGYRFGKKLAYITDIKTMEENELNKLKGLDILVLSAVFPGKHHSHMSLEEALDFIKKVRPGKAYLTHISHKMGRYNDISRSLPENVFVAYDNMEISL
ncbi:MAG: MBL fold metallo-hydrolase [Bacteroidales bacterium]